MQEEVSKKCRQHGRGRRRRPSCQRAGRAKLSEIRHTDIPEVHCVVYGSMRNEMWPYSSVEATSNGYVLLVL